MRQLLAWLFVMFSFAIGASAQSTVPITVPPYQAGPASYMHPQIYSVPIIIGGVSGTMWLYPQPCNANNVCGFIVLRAPLNGSSTNAVAVVTYWNVVSFNSIGQPASAMLNYTVLGDPDGDGDTDTLMGSITFQFSYTYVKPGCGGRFCAGWHETLSGSGSQLIAQN